MNGLDPQKSLSLADINNNLQMVVGSFAAKNILLLPVDDSSSCRLLAQGLVFDWAHRGLQSLLIKNQSEHGPYMDELERSLQREPIISGVVAQKGLADIFHLIIMQKRTGHFCIKSSVTGVHGFYFYEGHLASFVTPHLNLEEKSEQPILGTAIFQNKNKKSWKETVQIELIKALRILQNDTQARFVFDNLDKNIFKETKSSFLNQSFLSLQPQHNGRIEQIINQHISRKGSGVAQISLGTTIQSANAIEPQLVFLMQNFFDRIVWEGSKDKNCLDLVSKTKPDGAVLVIHKGQTKKRQTKKTMALLSDVEIPILGAVLAE